MKTIPCGCKHAIDLTWGVLKSTKKCNVHRTSKKNLVYGLKYYSNLGLVEPDGTMTKDTKTRYVNELKYALGDLPEKAGVALEIGTGCSPYVEYIRSLGYHYTGVERSLWATDWMRQNYEAHMIQGSFPDIRGKLDVYDLIWSAHCFEHLTNAPLALRRCFQLLQPGGYLGLLIPDDTDLYNSDHFWFFTPVTLKSVLYQIGFEVPKLVMVPVVEKENFIYCLAQKPYLEGGLVQI